MRKILAAVCLCLGSTALVAQYEERKTPEQIAEELRVAEVQFQKAKKMFNPWYTGPIITSGSSNMPQGWGNIAPYLALADNYAQFDKHRHSHHLDSDRVNLNPKVGMQFGITKTLDIALSLPADFNWQHHQYGAGFSDIQVTFGFPIYIQTVHAPGIRFAVQETLPTGQYQHLNHNGYGLSSTGGGSYQTQMTLAISKVFFWDTLHPLNLRWSFSYNFASQVTVNGFNTYGGGYGTHARIFPGKTVNADMGIEISLTQRWVLATDIAYTASNETTFSGHPGTTTKGGSTLASLGGAYSDNLSLAPAIEYNWNENIGIIGGVWFSVYGRNSNNFVTGVLNFTWTFQVN
ncbi:MAG: hypothetical protein HW387_1187 [Parachlamydiales bacterium]|nr:hypothetical protein [Parachlamydiales bacterium]